MTKGVRAPSQCPKCGYKGELFGFIRAFTGPLWLSSGDRLIALCRRCTYKVVLQPTDRQ
jgi:hypothetical protein